MIKDNELYVLVNTLVSYSPSQELTQLVYKRITLYISCNEITNQKELYRDVAVEVIHC